MIEELLPAGAVGVDTREDLIDQALMPGEARVIERAVEKRRREFITARACARAALHELGLPAVAILPGERGEPLWPAGIVGSITHCAGYRAAVVARAEQLQSIGIDAEPNAALPERLLEDIARPEERSSLRLLEAQAPEIHWGRLLFSAKESIYKAWFPLAKRWLGFEDASLALDLEACAFTARLLVAGPRSAEGELRGFAGRWLVRDGIIVTATAQPIYADRASNLGLA